MDEPTTAIRQYLGDVTRAIEALPVEDIDRVATILRAAYDEERTIFVMGNGGSAATASHLACDLNKGASAGARKRFRVMALTDNLPTILALANDVGYDAVFVEQLKCFARTGDVVIGISGSGNSPNVLRAVAYARDLGCTTIGVCGYNGGRLKRMVDCSVHVELDDMQVVEDLHMMLAHTLMRVLTVRERASAGRTPDGTWTDSATGTDGPRPRRAPTVPFRRSSGYPR
jgi:D-sedoheptulose 7-phosphate isomerase